jgi:hypothetical protein
VVALERGEGRLERSARLGQPRRRFVTELVGLAARRERHPPLEIDRPPRTPAPVELDRRLGEEPPHAGTGIDRTR